jgi:hypothetical protein
VTVAPGRDRGTQVGAPDVVPVDQPGHDRPAAQRTGRGQPRQVALAGDQVDAERLDRGVQQRREGVAELTEVRGHEDLRPRSG